MKRQARSPSVDNVDNMDDVKIGIKDNGIENRIENRGWTTKNIVTDWHHEPQLLIIERRKALRSMLLSSYQSFLSGAPISPFVHYASIQTEMAYRTIIMDQGSTLPETLSAQSIPTSSTKTSSISQPSSSPSSSSFCLLIGVGHLVEQGGDRVKQVLTKYLARKKK